MYFMSLCNLDLGLHEKNFVFDESLSPKFKFYENLLGLLLTVMILFTK